MEYECDQCGACCTQLIVEVDALDVLREARLPEADPHFAGKSQREVVSELDEEGKVIILACGSPCHFLDENKCSIYPTRPNVCVAMQAGDDQCQEARAAAGLLPLLPIDAAEQ